MPIAQVKMADFGPQPEGYETFAVEFPIPEFLTDPTDPADAKVTISIQHPVYNPTAALGALRFVGSRETLLGIQQSMIAALAAQLAEDTDAAEKSGD